MISGIWHVGFSVRSIERSVRFYTEGVGLQLVHQQSQDNPYTHALVGYPDASLRVAQFALPEVPPPPSGHILELIEYVVPHGEHLRPENNRIAAGHLALEVDDIFDRFARMCALDATPMSDPVEITAGINAGGHAVYLHDPDGITIELLQPRWREPAPGQP